MILSPLEQRLVAALEQMEIIDAHEHLDTEARRVQTRVDVFTLFAHYTRGDLRVAGMSETDYNATQNPDLPLDYRWRLFAPYWERIRWGSYARAALIAAQKFYGADDINEKTYAAISERMAQANKPGIYQLVLGEACKIRTALSQCVRTDLGTPLLTPVMPLVTEMETWDQVCRPTVNDWRGNPRLMDSSASVRTLDDLVAANRAYIVAVKSEGAVGLKMASNPYQSPSRAEAQGCFEQLCKGQVQSLPYRNPLRDYVVDEMIRFAGEQDLVVAVHTGYWGDFRTLDPLHMIPILERHPRVRFDLYHLGYPWVRESLMLGKGFANAWINFCWTHVISQKFAQDGLDEAIDLLPMNKIIGFGGDYHLPVEKTYGHLVMAREDIARVLAARIERKQMTEEQATALARKWLWDNPVELYRLKV
jgi:predicted TIM-barrel fold metal-dependent hydrolase